MKRVLTGLLIVCLVLLLCGAGWMLYRKADELSGLSDRFSELSEEYAGVSESSGKLSQEYSGLSEAYEALVRKAQDLLEQYLEARGHGNGTTESFAFTESSGELHNPNRGFYHMHGFLINDKISDYRRDIAGRYAEDRECGLTLIEINLQRFREKEISAAGLQSLNNVLEALEGTDKQWILRFVYDWDGKNLQHEPDRLEVILRHMEQVSDLLKRYDDRIFVVQGLFVGNYGEMNNSKYLGTEEMKTLTQKLFAAVGEKTYLSVRTPAQWRSITGLSDPTQAARGDGSPASRMGLYNDGMLGSETDLGTYGQAAQASEEPFSQWSRQKELAFQDILCRLVPIGGEAVIDNEYNDFENALKDMKAMHVTYLNWDYDTKVMDKWRSTTVHEESCFDGMDGLSYMERHLGYRLVIRGTALDYDWKADRLTTRVTLQNVGFAPVYREAAAELTLYDRERGRKYVYALEDGQDIRNLAGGTEEEELMTLKWDLPLGGLPSGELEVYFVVTDVLSGEEILFGNEQEPDQSGYRVGTLKLEPTEELREQWEKEWQN